MNEQLLKVDSQLEALVGSIDILSAVAPLNYAEQKQAFFEASYNVSPSFVYREQQLDVFKFKRALFNIPVEELDDEDLVTLYTDIICSYADKASQSRLIGSSDFLYESLRYYGEPTQKDLRNAKFILHLPEPLQEPSNATIDAAGLTERMAQFAQAHGYNYSVKTDPSMMANALMSGTVLKINPSVAIADNEASALAHHELGVHLVTTLNGRNQPIRALSLGSPVNTLTQEGIAILSEYLAGFMSVPRFKILALRVLAVDSLIKDRDFRKTFAMLIEDYGVGRDLAFTICARVYRGGGLTKDYLYLRGLHEMLNAYETLPDFNNLLAGKVSLAHLPLITRLIEKGFVLPPKFITPAIAQPAVNREVDQYIAHAIK
jgi:uncharacterized protein (TIGR02421 family)